MLESLSTTNLKIIPSQILVNLIKSLEFDKKCPDGIRRLKQMPVPFKINAQYEKAVQAADATFISSLRDEYLNLDITNKPFLNFYTSPVDSTPPFLTVDDLKWINERLADRREHGNDTVFLHEILRDCEIHLPLNKVTERNPVLEERCKKLRNQQKNREYRMMTKNVDSVRVKHPEDTFAFQVKEMNKQLIAVLQFVISVLAGFAFGFIGVELIVGNLDFGFRLLLGIICALVIALAEIYFLAKKLSEDPTLVEFPEKISTKPHQE